MNDEQIDYRESFDMPDSEPDCQRSEWAQPFFPNNCPCAHVELYGRKCAQS